MIQEFIRQHQNLALVLLLGIILLIALGMRASFASSGTQRLDVTVLPTDAQLYVNDIAVGGTRQLLQPGHYMVRAEREGFATTTQAVTIADKSQEVVLKLSPASSAARDWIDEHKDLYGEGSGDPTGADPIVTRLPYQSLLFKLEKHAIGSDGVVELSATTIRGYRSAPVNHVRALGLDPANYRFLFNYENPFNAQ